MESTKFSKLNMNLPTHLYDAIKEEAKNHNVHMSTYIRAVLAHQVFSKQKIEIVSEDRMFIADHD